MVNVVVMPPLLSALFEIRLRLESRAVGSLLLFFSNFFSVISLSLFFYFFFNKKMALSYYTAHDVQGVERLG